MESSLLKLNAEDGAYELKGEIGMMALPSNLSDSLRLRLAVVERCDAPLHLLVKLAAVRDQAVGQPHCAHARGLVCVGGET